MLTHESLDPSKSPPPRAYALRSVLATSEKSRIINFEKSMIREIHRKRIMHRWSQEALKARDEARKAGAEGISSPHINNVDCKIIIMF